MQNVKSDLSRANSSYIDVIVMFSLRCDKIFYVCLKMLYYIRSIESIENDDINAKSTLLHLNEILIKKKNFIIYIYIYIYIYRAYIKNGF